MASVDVTVRGGGIFGLSVAWACARRGAKVRLIERERIGAGASGGLVGALAPHAPESWNEMKGFQFDSLLMAESWWREVAQAGGEDPGYLRSGRLQPLADARAVDLARERAEAAKTLWRGAALWQVQEATGAEWEPASPTGFLIFDTLTARLSPRAAGAALLAALRATGAEIVIGEGRDEGQVIHATGVAGLGDLSAALGRTVGSGVKGQAALLRHDARDLPQIYAPGLHLVPHANGTVAVGSTSETQWSEPGPDRQAHDLIARARALLPCLARAEVLELWAGLRPRAKSRMPLIGAWPGREGHFIANGGFKTGFGMAPRCAELLAALVLADEDGIPPAFRPDALA
ncbi:NAD(P)/FAD-dependent oxidoreductase [Pseudogemmobacter humi]|uniref:Glycine oxidase n=1 Tax=Pseudogemmobacter humi TaxID=2483812 RepID=A0A3P5X658_9RHOB|nr:FAD-binding oxidoreductase [Pseudogemmobacter humi]VDC23749.1 Glycine oxidase [Pseudogemmobacter humi]